ncbi:hypothetical protein Esi_0155_0018 [Ectocarpus siliculosus]|uniref:Uncharacterized protein n=1 Tax=Ectocarpus siliculosus TaxID=2880 RepID=D8LFZ6_ECTSI|nr:hypothetical protein Esi_0155_0018 [Ectocarpus siliculosus]|eukprot:CBN78895.1 hypothetical protein Esi_0155_0018 [Ectocarpus siliculosus]
MLYMWPYACIPLAFSIDSKLRARWLLEDVSKPASGYRFRGANIQMVLTSRVKNEAGEPHEHTHGRSRMLDCTNLWPLAVVGPAVFVFAAEWSSGVVSVLLVCTPFVFLTLFSLTLNQVTILVSLLASPVVSMMYAIMNRGPGNNLVRSMLWSQAFIALTAVSLAWSVHGVITLRKTANAAAVAVAASSDPNGVDNGSIDDQSTADNGDGIDDDDQLELSQRTMAQAETPTHLPPETCILKAAEAILSGHPGCVDDEYAALAALTKTVRQARLHGLTVDTPVLQTANSLHAWSKVISHQGEVERDIRETDRWGVLEAKLISMNAGMPSMVGIIQGLLLAMSQLEDSAAYGSGPVGATFYFSLIAFTASIVASTVLLARMLTLIHGAAQGLASAAKKTDTAMETFVDLRSWGILRHGEVGCLTHIAAGRGMVRALDFLVRNGANPSAVDSTGQTPLDIAEESGMKEACVYLQGVISSSSQQRERDLLSTPIARMLKTKVDRARSPRSPPRKASDDKISEAQGDTRERPLVHGWRQVRKVAGSAARWIGMSEMVSARRASGRVGIEVRATSAADALGETTSQPTTEASAALRLPPALSISYSRDRCKDGENGGVLAPVGSSPSSSAHSSSSSFSSQAGHGDNDRINRHVSPSAMTPGTIATSPAAGVCREGVGDTGETMLSPGREVARRRAPDAMPGGDLIYDQLEMVNDDSEQPTAETPSRRTSSSTTKRNGRQRGGTHMAGGGEAEAGEETTAGGRAGGIDTGACVRDDRVRGRLEDGANASRVQEESDEAEERSAESGSSRPAPRRSSVSSRLSASISVLLQQNFSGDEGTHGGGRGSASGRSPRSDTELVTTVTEAFLRSPPTPLSTTLRRRLSSTRATSGLKNAAAADNGGKAATYSPTQAVLNITWALRRLRPLGTPRERRAAFEGLRESSPVHIPQMYLLAFVDLAELGEIPQRTGNRFLGHGSKRPLAVCYLVQKLAKRLGRKPYEFYLWIDYACINQQNPSADRLALPCVLDSCDYMVYVEDDEYWDQALSRTEHFLFHKLRRLRPPANGASAYEEDVFSLSADGEKLMQRTYAETRARFTHNPAKGSLTTETDRLYLWTLVLALEYEDCYSFTANLPPQDETGFMKLLREAVFVNSCMDPRQAAAEIADRDAQMHADAADAATEQGREGRGEGRTTGVRKEPREGGPPRKGAAGVVVATVDSDSDNHNAGDHQEGFSGPEIGASRSDKHKDRDDGRSVSARDEPRNEARSRLSTDSGREGGDIETGEGVDVVKREM